jgi:hypothetical protein
MEEEDDEAQIELSKFSNHSPESLVWFEYLVNVWVQVTET